MSYYTEAEVQELGLKACGHDVKISRKASIYGAERISIGNHVRIDDFCVLSAGEGGISIGSYIHIAVYSLLMGQGAISLADFSGLSSRVSVYSSNDDYSGQWLTNPTVPAKFTGVKHAPVQIGRHAIVGSGTIILPGVIIEQGAAVGALSLVKKRCREFGIYFGCPAKQIGERSRNLLELEQQLLQERLAGT